MTTTALRRDAVQLSIAPDQPFAYATAWQVNAKRYAAPYFFNGWDLLSGHGVLDAGNLTRRSVVCSQRGPHVR